MNPFDEEKTAETIQRALSLPLEERRERLEALRKRVERNNVFHWSEQFIARLEEAASERAKRLTELPKAVDLVALVQKYREAPQRLLCFSYEGTLAPYSPRPKQSAPAPDLVKLVASLAANPANVVALISGRRRDDLHRWFGAIPRLWMAAEYGALVRPGGAEEWRTTHPNLSTD